MVWEPQHRAYYFGCACGDGLTAEERLRSDCRDGAEADEAFGERYCAPDRPRIKGTEARLGGVPVAVARCVLSRLTLLLPHADHGTPGWSGTPTPLVAIGRMARNGRVDRPRCGLCAQAGELFLWADEAEVMRLTGGTTGWTRWRRTGAPSGSWVLRFDRPLGCRCDADPRGGFPDALIAFLTKLAAQERLSASLHPDAPVVPREACVLLADDPDEAADDPDPPVGSEPAAEPGAVPAPDAPPAVSGGGACIRRAIHHARQSMLRVLRCVAIERMRTAVPGFDRHALDSLIMSTGYPAAARPHADAADLFHVVAANLANAAGGRPEPDAFARATVEAMRGAGCFAAAPHRLSHVPTESQLVAALGAVPVPPGGWSRRMQAFLDSARAMAQQGGPAAPGFTHVSMIRGVVDVAAWLRDNHGSSAAVLHAAMSGAAAAPHAAVWQAIRQLDACRGMGVALAANLLKDSQVPGLVAVHANPRAIAAVTAGWFAKPDLHVVRFIAKITRGMPLHSAGRRQSLRLALGCMATPPVGAGAPGHFPGRYRHVEPGPLELRVIADLHAWASATDTSALEIERLLYLIGARRVEVSVPGGVTPVNAAWYRVAEAAIDEALVAGVPRLS